MKLHPFLQDPNCVVVFRARLDANAGAVAWEEYRRAAVEALASIKVELDGESAVIKPNVTSGEHFADPDTGIGTHPGFVQGIVEYLQGYGARSKRITIAEDPRNTDDNLPRRWRGTGYERIAQEIGVKLHTPTTYTCVKKNVKQPLAHSQLNVSRLATASGTVLFNVPKLKTHNLAITTLCMKNLMGLVSVFDRHYCTQAWQEMPEAVRSDPRPRREWFSEEMHACWQAGLARRLVDTARVIRPALNIIEGIVGREGTGFQRGRNRPLGLVIAGTNMVAVDSLASYMMGFDPQSLVYLQMAAQAGLGENDPAKLRVYLPQEGVLSPCPDIRSLRLDPPFQVIRNVQGEDPELFKDTSLASADLSGSH